MADLEWEKLLKLQSPNGSFLFSPASTAFALIETKDDNCLRYLNNIVEKFNGGVPWVYPVDLFEHIWVVDRLQRLGISRYFGPEIKQCIDYVYRYWSEEGICWARNSTVHDIDDTAMGFRLLRLHGYEVSADVFRHFKNGGEFFCIAGQSNQAVTGMYNLYRASQVLFPGDDILEEAKKFSFRFLRGKQATNELLDKWIITKDLPGEVGYALDVPWHASLPRLETRFFLDQYGGDDDVWIGKTLYRMPYVNNKKYLELAKLDYNNCQAMHQQEWDLLQEWYEECNLEELGMSQRSLLLQFYLATASIFETQRSKERLAWAKTAMLVETIMSYFEREEVSREHRRALVQEFRNSSNTGYATNGSRRKMLDLKKSRNMLMFVCRYKRSRGFVATLLGIINQLSLDTLVAYDRDIHNHLRHAWEMWLLTWQEEGDVYKGEAELLVRTISLCGGRCVSEDYRRLSDVANRVCHQLGRFQSNKIHDTDSCNTYTGGIMTAQIESSMQELVQLVLCDSSDGLDAGIKQTFLAVAKAFYYTAYCNPGIVNVHIAKVLFDRLL
ncbi:hypothetical protein RJ639_004768 [Escallonia herrerae]|uniref:ent-kaurene synthase n=1 Tax=Escallonia herrerae TaxID=1293975 RepID=A0AA88VZH5_9ASTE|nr:hypothetical protein RJ639_004768 [Escallonia herrerae]